MVGTRWQVVLEEAGIRVTPHRIAVLEVLAGHTRPVAAQQIHLELVERGEAIGLSTVYRAVSSLAMAGLVHVFSQVGEATYRLCGPVRHHHLICRICRLVIERSGEEDMDGFQPEEIYGICPACRRAS
ncbi:Fur family ferric uptake transcriptional regulator [Thermocatellispora tengchongensis]|uniref:Fur family ferric uptake transcriptional regulator n=1 Tax=Thermocatellispora tengchongensis TaxID=1073253 RepID=A0A840PQW5_9ACTN|nr:Fur family transcriptional regulator [Thermocatellispora tengchongensis]MBB5138375.1 Fur family ferric uptake transcriptional regulator [Thermocatellispora tengchongensis]